MEDIKEKYAEEIGVIRQASQRSWFWLGIAGVLGSVAMTLFIIPAVVPAMTAMTIEGGSLASGFAGVKWGALAVGAVIGGAGIIAARHSVSVDVDRDVQIEDINARRSAEYGAKALVKELEDAGLTVKPNDEVKQPDGPRPSQRIQPHEHQARVSRHLSVIVNK